MSKRPTHLIVTRIAADGRATTERMTAEAFMEANPEHADEARRVIKTGNTRALSGLYLARGAGDVR